MRSNIRFLFTSNPLLGELFDPDKNPWEVGSVSPQGTLILLKVGWGVDVAHGRT